MKTENSEDNGLRADTNPPPNDGGLTEGEVFMPNSEEEPASPLEERNSDPPKEKREQSLLSKIIDGVLWALVVGVLFLAVMPRNSGPKLGPAASIGELPLVSNGAPGETRKVPGSLERPLLIEAFASWCGACRRQSGLMGDLAEAQKAGKLDVLAVSVDRSAKKALEAKNSWPIPVDVVHDARGEFSKLYNVEVLPTYVLVGTDGQVKRVTTGTAGASDIRAWLSEGE
jgi:thiol-disulfide isomerase/thioredoxin